MFAAWAAPWGGAAARCSPPHPLRRCRHPRPLASTRGLGQGAQDTPMTSPGCHEQDQQFDIVSGGRLPAAQGPSCDWPRVQERRRWEEAALMATGFPVPSGYGSASQFPADGSGVLWRLRNPERNPPAPAAPVAGTRTQGAVQRQARLSATRGTAPGPPMHSAAAKGGRGQWTSSGCGPGPFPGLSHPVMPVFRAAPYSAEAARQRGASPTARILVLDEGCSCRAPLAAAMLQAMLSKVARPLDVEVCAASIGPPVPGGPDQRVAQLAREMDVPLPPRGVGVSEFDEMRDTVAYDLILVMDRYDRQEVVREVSVLERLNPGGAYLCRVRRLGEYARAARLVLKDRCLLAPDDLPDPFYGVVNAAAEQAALRAAVHAIALGCRGLVSYLLKLRARCGSGTAAVPVRVALAQSVQCPLMDPTSPHALRALAHFQRTPDQPLLLQQQGQRRLDGGGNGPAAAMHPRRAGRGVGIASAGTPAAMQLGAEGTTHGGGWPRPVWVEQGSDSSGEDDGSTEDRRPLWTVREVGGQTVVVRRSRRQQAPTRGYWGSIENVQRELWQWIEERGLQGRLPSQRELRSSGANTLSAKVDAHGGLAVFAERMRLPLASGRAANGHWADFDCLARELRWFVEQQQEQQMGGQAAEEECEHDQKEGEEGSGASDPPAATTAGTAGAGEVEEQHALGGVLPCNGREEESSIDGGLVVRRSLRYASSSWSSGGGGRRPGPHSATLLAADGSEICDSSASKSRSVGSAGSSDADSSGSGDGKLVFLPTQQELRRAGRADLIGGIRRHGGSLAVARRLGWAVHHGRLPSEAVVVVQLLEFAEQRQRQRQQHRTSAASTGGGTAAPVLAMPSLRELEEGGRADLAGAVQRLGGVQVFACLIEAEKQRRQRRGRRSSVQEQQLQAEAGAEAVHGQQAPTHEQQQGAPLQRASHILAYSGRLAGARLGGHRLPPLSPPQPAVVRVGQAVVQLIAARGWEARVPTKQELVAAGRRDLHAAIARCGGAQKLAEHLQLPYAETRGRRKRCGSPITTQQPQQQEGAQQQPLELQPDFLASRLRPPPGDVGLAAQPPQTQLGGSIGRSGGGSSASRARQCVPAAQRARGPASRLLERELVLEAYTDTTFV